MMMTDAYRHMFFADIIDIWMSAWNFITTESIYHKQGLTD